VNGGIAGVRVRFEPATQADAALRDPHTLAVIGFAAGARPQPGADPRWLQVGLAPLDAPMVEVWHGSAPVQHGRQDDGLCWAEDGSHQMGVLQIEEADFDGDIARASEHAYRTMQQCLASRRYPHLLRIWNYLDAIVDGDGDQERYRQFCIGRARGLGDFDPRPPRSAGSMAYACCRCTGWRPASQASRWKTRARSAPTTIRASTGRSRRALPVRCCLLRAARCR